mmetsp:Transcript_111028/g.264969  ORF Transcript_111028/g.264969 Transcript_111028/m.264969 type:complete len:212 (-) Transcript_111028:1341-1976(-)
MFQGLSGRVHGIEGVDLGALLHCCQLLMHVLELGGQKRDSVLLVHLCLLKLVGQSLYFRCFRDGSTCPQLLINALDAALGNVIRCGLFCDLQLHLLHALSRDGLRLDQAIHLCICVEKCGLQLLGTPHQGRHLLVHLRHLHSFAGANFRDGVVQSIEFRCSPADVLLGPCLEAADLRGQSGPDGAVFFGLLLHLVLLRPEPRQGEAALGLS